MNSVQHFPILSEQEERTRRREFHHATIGHKERLSNKLMVILVDLAAQFPESPYAALLNAAWEMNRIAEEYSDANYAEYRRIFENA